MKPESSTGNGRPCKHGTFVWIEHGGAEHLINPACVESVKLRYEDFKETWLVNVVYQQGMDQFEFETELHARLLFDYISGDEIAELGRKAK